MKKIGFIDYFLDEFHANNYPAWIKDNSEKFGRNVEVAYAWADTEVEGKLTTDEWCEKYNVERLSSIEELVEKSDYIIVLSPDNPEHHERLAELPLKSGKPVYVDKTFSPDLASGARLFELAEKYNTPMCSSSALRFSKEIMDYPDEKVNTDTIEFVTTIGPGKFSNYAVHQLEMIVALLGPDAKRIKSHATANGRVMMIEFAGGKMASMVQMAEAPFQVMIQTNDGATKFIGECTDFFEALIHEMLDFFETGKVAIPKDETLAIMALLEAGNKALEQNDVWVEI